MARTRLTRRTKRRDPDDAKARILEAAPLFATEGVSVPMARIAKEAGVSEGLVFHHYGNKRGLLAAVAAHMGHGVASAMFEGLLPGQRPDVRRMIRACFDYVGRNGKLHDMLAMSNDPGDWNAAMMATRGVIVAALTQAFTQWKAAGYIETDHLEIAAGRRVDSAGRRRADRLFLAWARGAGRRVRSKKRRSPKARWATRDPTPDPRSPESLAAQQLTADRRDLDATHEAWLPPPSRCNRSFE
ncbi:MAG: TetR/AcrR family transcriptional regulator [Polyangiales bacterium]